MTSNPTLCLLLSVIAGCGGSSTAATVPIEDLPAEAAQIYCDQLAACAGEAMADFLPFGDDCVEQFTNALTDGTLEQWKAAIEAGTVEYHADAAQACLDALDAMGCDLFGNRGPEICEDALDGNVPLGEDCGIDDECDGEAFCLIEAACPGTCSERLGESAACTDDSNCQDGLTCQRRTCLAQAGAGDSCGGPGGSECEVGLLCLGEDGDTPGTCTDADEIFTEAEGASCNVQAGPLCSGDLSCVVTSVVGPTFECQAGLDSGADCTLGFPDPCPDGEYCSGLDIGSGDIDGTCEALPAAGEACADTLFGDSCAEYLRCDPEALTCTAVERIGGDCDSDTGCYSDVCYSGSCVAPALCEVP